jgi:proline racemase
VNPLNLFRTIDAHAGGEPLRLIFEGFPAPRGKTMIDKRDWAGRNADGIRRVLMFEPRGHVDMCGAVLTEPVSPGSHAGVLFMHNRGYHALSGSGIVALTTIVLERGLLMPGGDGRTIVFDTPAGIVRAHATFAGEEPATRVERVSYVNVPSFVLHGGLPIKVGARPLRVDVAFGGGFYAIVDSEAAGLGVNPALAPELRRVGGEIRAAVESAQAIAHPDEPRLEGLDGVIFTAPPTDERADLRSVTVFANGAIDRSPGGNSTAAVMAVLAAMGLIAEEGLFTHEGITGSHFTGRISSRTVVGEYEAIVATLDASAWITGEHTFQVDEADPLREGFLL